MLPLYFQSFTKYSLVEQPFFCKTSFERICCCSLIHWLIHSFVYSSTYFFVRSSFNRPFKPFIYCGHSFGRQHAAKLQTLLQGHHRFRIWLTRKPIAVDSFPATGVARRRPWSKMTFPAHFGGLTNPNGPSLGLQSCPVLLLWAGAVARDGSCSNKARLRKRREPPFSPHSRHSKSKRAIAGH